MKRSAATAIFALLVLASIFTGLWMIEPAYALVGVGLLVWIDISREAPDA